jgi:gliding motility-associated-like protein
VAITDIEGFEWSTVDTVFWMQNGVTMDQNRQNRHTYATVQDGDQLEAIIAVTLCNESKRISSTNELFISTYQCSFPEVTTTTAFTPNGDGSNDYWKVPGVEAYKGATIDIFTRWGVKILSKTIDGENVWDGTWNGNKAPDGTYYYLLKLPGQEPIKGFITLMR